MEPTSVIHSLTLLECRSCYCPYTYDRCPISQFLYNPKQPAIEYHGMASGRDLGYNAQYLYRFHNEADENPNLKDELFETYKKIAEIRDTCPYRDKKNTK